MGQVREHEPIIIEEINGLWNRGDPETCPTDHFLATDDVNFIHSGVRTRTGISPYLVGTMSSGTHDFRRIVRMYNFVTQDSTTIIALEIHVQGFPFNTRTGRFHHIRQPNPLQFTTIGTMDDVDDFAMITIAGRAYISPIKYYLDGGGNWFGLGKPGESVYVYDPLSGSGMRKAAGPPPTNATGTPSDGGKKPLIAYNVDIDGKVTKGYHVFSIAFNDGLIEMSFRPAVDAPGGKVVKLTNIPIGPIGTTSRTIAMSKAVTPLAPGQDNKMYRVITIPDNTTTSFVVDISDAELTTEYVPGATPAPPRDAMIVVQSPDNGFADTGLHLFGVVYESNTGYLSPPGPEFFTAQTLVESTKKIEAINVPLGPANTVRRHIVATKWIPDYYSGDQKGYQFYFVPKAVIENNTATTIKFDFYDSDLVADASHLLDNYSEIPSCVNFCLYHSRLVMVGDSSFPVKPDGITPDMSKGDNRCVARISAPGEPEAVSKVDGLIVTPLDGKPLTNCEQFRDILYLFKASRTYAYSDNSDEPGTWVEEVLDQGVGVPIHGIAEVLDSGGVNIDYLVIADYSGLMLFNGTYARPELTWKVEDLWMGQGRSHFHKLQIVNDSIGKKMWILPAYALDDMAKNNVLYHLDYSNGLDPKAIRWARWIINLPITSIALINTDELIISTWQVNIPDPPFPLYNPGYPIHLIRPGGRVIVDGRNVWEDELDDYPPLPPSGSTQDQLEGGIMIGQRSNPTKHDTYRSITGPELNLPIRGRIRTAFIGD